jgi:AraC-like DNA-binding protein
VPSFLNGTIESGRQNDARSERDGERLTPASVSDVAASETRAMPQQPRVLQRKHSTLVEDGSAFRDVEPARGIVEKRSATTDAALTNADRVCSELLRCEGVDERLSEITAPRKPGEIGARQRKALALQKWRLNRVIAHLDDHLSAKITLSEMSAVAGLSRMHFASQFRGATGLRPHEFLLRRRIRRAEELLRDTTMPIAEIALAVGFQTRAHLTTVFKRFVGYTPARWRALKQAPAAPRPRIDRRVVSMDVALE